MDKLEGLAPVLFSLIALIVSIITLYLSHLRPAKIRIIAGGAVNLFYFPEGNFGITLPVSFVNEGAKTGTVSRVALLIQKRQSKEGYLLEPHAYQRLDANQRFQHESTPSPISVPGNSYVPKQILFKTSVERPDEFLFEKGNYNLTLFGWIEVSVRPSTRDSFVLEIPGKVAYQLENWRKQKLPYTICVPQSKWRKWLSHHLTEIEVSALLKNPNINK